MSAPLIWIFFPLLCSFGLWFIRAKRNLTFYLALAICTLLGLTAWLQPIGSLLRLGSFSVAIHSTMLFMGRNFILDNSSRFFLVFIYFAAVFWFVASRISNAPIKFIPLALAIISLFVAAFAVEPFQYSAVIIEVAVILSLPLLMTRGEPIKKGVLRYFIYQSLAMPFILFAAWILTGAQANSSDLSQLNMAALLLGLGFAFLLAVFPFHIWIPELAEQSDAYTAGFLLSILPPIYLLLVLKFLNGLVWLRDSSFLPPVLQGVGVIMIVSGGIWSAVQTDLKRLFGFVVIMESGFSLLCLSLSSSQGNELFYLSLVPHLISLAVFAYAISCLERSNLQTNLSSLRGMAGKYPFVSLGILSSLLSVAGIPLFASFSIHQELFELLSAHSSLLIWLLAGYAFLMVAAFRFLITIMGTYGSKWGINETRGNLFFLAAGTLALILMGIFPSTFIGGIWKLFASLLHLA